MKEGFGEKLKRAAAHSGDERAFANQIARIALELEMDIRVRASSYRSRERPLQIVHAIVRAFHPVEVTVERLSVSCTLPVPAIQRFRFQVPVVGTSGIGRLRD